MWTLSISGMAGAHEMRPAVADLTVTDQTVQIRAEVNLEAIIASIDQRTYEDTNDAPQAEDYERLRKLSPDALREEFRPAWPSMRDKLTLNALDGRGTETPLSVRLSETDVIAEDNEALPRITVLTLMAELPDDATAIRVGWARDLGPVIARQMGVAEDVAYTGYLIDGKVSEPIDVARGSAESVGTVFVNYIPIGFTHIVPKGLDHILFVLGLFFLSLKWRPLLLQVTAFTIAHTITLALASFNLVTLPAALVEPLIAASIIYVAVENIFTRQLNTRRTWIVFGFGLLHGLGFASVLGDVGVNPAQLLPALIGFNIGVELGQLAVIALAFLSLGVWFGKERWYRPAIAIPASLVIAGFGAWWLVERTIL